MLGNLELGGAERQAVFLARYLIHECGVDVRIWGFNTRPGDKNLRRIWHPLAYYTISLVGQFTFFTLWINKVYRGPASG